MHTHLTQPLFSERPEPGHEAGQALGLDEFLQLLREEEDYYPGEEDHTLRMITRLRKIFYDQWGWNSELIRGARAIEGRYITKIVSDPPPKTGRKVRRYNNGEYQPKHRIITYRPDDRVYGNSREGQIPPICSHDAQEVRLPSGNYCDLAHILAGLDAFNYPQVVTPLPGFLLWAAKLFPHVDSNVDVVTWLGDIASSSGDFLFRNQHPDRDLDDAERQAIIERDAPGSDMLGNVDTYAIRHFFDTSAQRGMRVSDILWEYYHRPLAECPYRSKRIATFTRMTGLGEWTGTAFSRERQWIRFYLHHLRNNVAFQVFSLTDEKLDGIWLPLGVYFRRYDRQLEMKPLLGIWLKTLRQEMQNELAR
jgi:hypothetical protein